MHPNSPFALDLPPKTSPWQPIGDKTERSGQPVQRFRKEVTRTGTYSHPTDGWVLRVSPQRQQQWASRMQAMLDAGVEIPLCDDHEVSARSNRGFVVGYEVEGDKGYAIVEAIGEDAIRDVARNGASVFIERQVIDGEGRDYGEAITHVALTPTPVIPGMGDWVPIAASRQITRNGKPLTKAPLVRYYAASLTASPGTRNTTMDIRKTLGLAADVDDAAVEKALGDVKAKADAAAAAAAERDTFKIERDSLQAKVKELEKVSDNDKLDDETAADRGELVGERLDKLVKDNKITAAVAASLKPLLAGTDKARPAFMLSRKHAPGGGQYLARQITDALEKNDPKALASLAGERTGAQTMSLSRQAPASSEPSADTKALMDSMMVAAGVPKK